MSSNTLVQLVLANSRKFLQCKNSNESIDEVIKSIAENNEISIDSDEWKMLNHIAKIAVDNISFNLKESEKVIIEKAENYIKKEKEIKEKVEMDIEKSILLEVINVRLCILTKVANGNFTNYLKIF